MQLLIIFGPPAVGKTTVGQLIEQQTDFKLFHNHMIMDGVMHIFGIGTPAEDHLSKVIRSSVIDTAAEAGIDLIFTYVWNFGRDKGKRNIDEYVRSYTSRGGTVRFVELVAPLAVRQARADHPERRRHKAHAPLGDDVVEMETRLNFQSPTPFFYPDAYKQIDTSDKTPEHIAQEILAWLHA